MNNTPSFCSSAPIIPNVRNEFGSLKTAVISAISNPAVHAAAFGGTDEESRDDIMHPGAPPDVGAHLLYAELLQQHGVNIVHPHHPNLPLTEETIANWIGRDFYCRDFLGVVDDHSILTRIDDFRNDSRMQYLRLFERIPSAQRTMFNQQFTWGNALLYADKLLVGHPHNDYWTHLFAKMSSGEFFLRQQRGDACNAGITAMQTLLHSIESTRDLIVLAMDSSEDLDTCLAPLPRSSHTSPRRAIYEEKAFHAEGVEQLRRMFDDLIPYQDYSSDLGLNLLWINPETPVVASEAVNTIRTLRDLGYNPIPRSLNPIHFNMEIEDKAKEGGGWRCMTGVLERENDYPY